MSIDQYQISVNSLDKEIADLEKKKAVFDKKSVDALKQSNSISVNRNTSESMIRTKMSQKERYNNEYSKALQESAKIQEKIADKRKKRNDENIKLQKEEMKEQQTQRKADIEIQKAYENRIREIQRQSIPSFSSINSVGLQNEEKLLEYDVFISHASEDKESFVDDLASELRKKNIKVWYDTNSIKWGDSLRSRIDEGLRKSKYGIVVLSPNYIAENKYWTKTELDGLFQLESVTGKRLLPIWHNLTKQQVMDYSPTIVGRKAVSTATMTAEEMANEFAKLLSKSEIENKTNGETNE